MKRKKMQLWMWIFILFLGGCCVSFMLGYLEAKASNHIVLFVVWGLLFLFVLLAGFMILYLNYEKQKKSIHSLVMLARRMSHPTFQQKEEYQEQDEFTPVAEAIQQLGKQIAYEIKTRNQLIADVAHEIRTPLTIVRGQLEVLSTQEEVKPVQLFPMIDETIRMSRLIQDLQQLSLAEANQITLRRSWLNYRNWLEQMIEVLQVEAEEKKVSLHIQTDVESEVYWDSLRMKQVVINLLGNAIQYTPSGGQICINSSEYKGKVTLMISDNGPGIPPEKLPYIFRRFYRVDGSRNRLSGGTGLGLAIAKEFVEHHEGSIQVQSELGIGTTFTVVIPIFPEG